MKPAWITLCLLLLGGCDRWLAQPAQDDAAPELTHLLEGPPPDVALPQEIYREAYERARETITHENAPERLDAIDRAIDEDLGGVDEGRE